MEKTDFKVNTLIVILFCFSLFSCEKDSNIENSYTDKYIDNKLLGKWSTSYSLSDEHNVITI